MKKAEIILAALALASALMKILHLQGAEILLIVSLTPLAFLYFYLGTFLFNNIALKHIFSRGGFSAAPRKHIIIGAITGIAIGVYIISFLFGFLKMQGAVSIANVALGLLLLSLVLCLINALREKSPFYQRILIRLGVAGLLIVVQVSL